MADTQPLVPTDAEIIALADEIRTAERCPGGYILPVSFARAVLAKWGAQPVACEPLTDSQPQAGAVPMSHEDAKALILQLVEALEGYRRNHNDTQPCDAERAGRARLEAKK